MSYHEKGSGDAQRRSDLVPEDLEQPGAELPERQEPTAERQDRISRFIHYFGGDTLPEGVDILQATTEPYWLEEGRHSIDPAVAKLALADETVNARENYDLTMAAITEAEQLFNVQRGTNVEDTRVAGDDMLTTRWRIEGNWYAFAQEGDE